VAFDKISRDLGLVRTGGLCCDSSRRTCSVGSRDHKPRARLQTWSSAAFSRRADACSGRTPRRARRNGFFFANLSQTRCIASGEAGQRRPATGHSPTPSATGLLNSGRPRSPYRPARPSSRRSSEARGCARSRGAAVRRPALVDLLEPKYFPRFASPKNAYADPIFTTFPTTSSPSPHRSRLGKALGMTLPPGISPRAEEHPLVPAGHNSPG